MVDGVIFFIKNQYHQIQELKECWLDSQIPSTQEPQNSQFQRDLQL